MADWRCGVHAGGAALPAGVPGVHSGRFHAAAVCQQEEPRDQSARRLSVAAAGVAGHLLHPWHSVFLRHLPLFVSPPLVLFPTLPASLHSIIFWAFEFGTVWWVIVLMARGYRFNKAFKFHHYTIAEHQKSVNNRRKAKSFPNVINKIHDSVLKKQKSRETFPISYGDNLVSAFEAMNSTPKIEKQSYFDGQENFLPDEVNPTAPVALEGGILQFEEGTWRYISNVKLINLILYRSLSPKKFLFGPSFILVTIVASANGFTIMDS
ncbi:hypothetical protein HK096_003265 [Nowakowskiella sp. JEL0078]|nr:hypothetical protein HK096_003265 [Nowakowskiella sp. JEL0078]